MTPYPITNNLINGLPREPYRHGIGAYEGVVAHETDDYASDEAEVSYFERVWQTRQAFVHYFVDWGSIRQIADIDYIAWGAGHVANQRYVHVELCRTHVRQQFQESYKRYVWLIAWILYRKRLGVEFGRSLVTHHWVSQNLGGTDHTDPDGYLASWGMSISKLTNDVQEVYNAMDNANTVTSTPILGPATATVEQAQAWAKNCGATDEFISLSSMYWSMAAKRGGVNPAVAYAQAAKETAFGRFGGVLNSNYHNPCGLKTHDGGANDDAKSHQHFGNWVEGVSAHLDHLALYAGAEGYPRIDTLDPRHFPFICGTAKSVEQLGGKWAPAADYGQSIVKNYLQPMIATKPPEPDWQAEGLKWLQTNLAVDTSWKPTDPLTIGALGEILRRYDEKK